MEKQYTVLIVDDSQEISEAMASIINQTPDFEVVGLAPDGIEGLRSYATLKPDIVITDDVMPRMDGLTMVSMIRVVNPDVRVLLMSARPGELEAVERREAEVALGLVKPFTEKELIDSLRSLICDEVLNLDEL